MIILRLIVHLKTVPHREDHFMHRKILLLILICSGLATTASSQDYTHVYHLDNNYSTVKQSKATITGKGLYENGLFRLDCYNNKTGFLTMSAHFTDSSLSVLQGLFQSYDILSRLVLEGNYVNNEKEGVWQSWNEHILKKDSTVYQHGVRTFFSEFYYGEDRRLLSVETTDSLKNTFLERAFNDSGKLRMEASFVGEKGLVKYYNNNKVTVDTVFTRQSKEAEFPGGNSAWAHFLEQALSNFNPADYGASAGRYEAVAKFIVDVDGSISDVVAETHFGHGIESKVIDIIKKGPKWVPAVQYGRNVKAYRRQPVTFLVEKQ